MIHRLSILLCLAALGVASFAQPPEPPGRKGKKGPRIAKPRIADTVKATIYADNWCAVYINGTLTIVDSISFIPHNVVSVDILPEYPMTIAVLAREASSSSSVMGR